MKNLRISSSRMTQKKNLTQAVKGVLSALVLGTGISFGSGIFGGCVPAFGAEPAKNTQEAQAAGAQNAAQGGWVVDNVVGAYRYYGADGQMWTNAITPDGYYVDRNGVMIHPQYEIEKLSTIPADAKSLLVIEGHGNAGRATFYLKEETTVEAVSQKSTSSAASVAKQALSPKQTSVTINQKTVSRQAPGEAQAEASGNTAAKNTTSNLSAQSTAPGLSAQVASDQNTAAPEKKVSWKMLFNTNSTLGRMGIGKEVEGDEKTPRGFYTLDIAFGTEPDPGNFKVPYLQVHDGHYWVGDSESSYYNQLVDIRQTGEVFDKKKAEHLSTIAGIGYHYCMSVGYNKECTPYKGSAIFLHCIEGPVTAGCIGIPKEDMVKLLENIQQPAYILIDDGENLKSY